MGSFGGLLLHEDLDLLGDQGRQLGLRELFIECATRDGDHAHEGLPDAGPDGGVHCREGARGTGGWRGGGGSEAEIVAAQTASRRHIVIGDIFRTEVFLLKINYNKTYLETLCFLGSSLPPAVDKAMAAAGFVESDVESRDAVVLLKLDDRVGWALAVGISLDGIRSFNTGGGVFERDLHTGNLFRFALATRSVADVDLRHVGLAVGHLDVGGVLELGFDFRGQIVKGRDTDLLERGKFSG